MLIYILLIFALFGVVLIFWRPFYGLLMVIVANQIEYFIPIKGEWSVGRIIGLAVALGWLGHIMFRGGSRFLQHRQINLLLVAYLLSVTVGVLLNLDEQFGFAHLIRLCILVAMVWMIQDLIENRRQILVLTSVIAISYGLASVSGIMQFVAIQSGVQFVGDVSGRGGAVRFAGLYGNPNALGIMLMSGIPYLVLWLRKSRSWIMRGAYSGILLLCLFSLFLTGSRTHFLAFITFGCTYFFTEVRFRTIGKAEIAIGLLVMVLTAGAILLAPEQNIQRITGQNIQYDTSAHRRLQLFEKGLFLLGRNPFFGIGLGNFRNHEPERGMDAHDTISVTLGESGIVGTAFLILLCAVVVIMQMQIIKRLLDCTDDFLLCLGIFTHAAFLAFLVSAIGNIIIYQRMFWIYIALSCVLLHAEKYDLLPAARHG